MKMMRGAVLLQQSGLDPGGPNARIIKSLGIFFLILLGIIFLTVVALAIVPMVRRRRGTDQEPLEITHKPSIWTERRLGVFVGAASAATLLILFGLVAVSVSVGKSISAPEDRRHGMVIEVTGNQWWWSVRYVNDDASRIVVTANELHIPVGRPVLIRGNSNDVIHSFWIPGLQGKRDLIPGHVTTEWLEASRPGKFRGQCAEFCGLQHAHMAMWVIAEPVDRFNTWMNRQLEAAAEPANADLLRGQQVFLTSACAMCHTIAGTGAAGQIAPDLTHFGSRLTLAAGTLPNNKGNLAGWIADPQTIKPGTHMPAIPVAAEDLQPLINYLESLQ